MVARSSVRDSDDEREMHGWEPAMEVASCYDDVLLMLHDCVDADGVLVHDLDLHCTKVWRKTDDDARSCYNSSGAG